MGMFLNYQNVSPSYYPDNITQKFPVGKSYTKLDPIQASKPYEEYDFAGNLIGYYWHYGDTLKLEFNIDGEIMIENDAIVLNHVGETPSENIPAYVGQKCYNIVDLKSWTCTHVLKNQSYWKQDEEFTYPTEDGRSVYISADEYIKDKVVELVIYNFRHEKLYIETYQGTSTIIFDITSEVSKTLKEGIYYCSLRVFNDNTSITIFNNDDCKLIVR